MKLAILKERRPGEARVAGSPEVARKLIELGFEVAVERGAGAGASFTDANFRDAGASIADDAAAALDSADVIFKVQRPISEGGAKSELASMPKGALLIANPQALAHKKDMEACAEAGITAFAMDLMPRITRAQSMDVLSSQSNLAGYRAALDAAAEIGRAFPMMMTAAGTIAPAKVLVIGAGVAGLQAIATAKRLGAVVTGYDVRASAKEQVESLGGRFLEVDPEAAAGSRDRRRLREGNERRVSEEAGRGAGRGAQETGHRHLHGVDPGQAGAGPDYRGRGQGA